MLRSLRRVPLRRAVGDHPISFIGCCARRAMSSMSDQETMYFGDDVFSTMPAPPQKDFMYLPPPGTYRRGAKLEPLINVPPPEDPLLSFLTSMIMTHGERAKARRAVANTLLYIYTCTRAPPLPILREAILLASPAIKTRTESHGSKTLVIPIAISERQRTHMGIKWLLDAAKKRPGNKLADRLAREMIDVVQRTKAAEGVDPENVTHTGALAQKQTLHKFGMVNRGGVRVRPELQRAAGAGGSGAADGVAEAPEPAAVTAGAADGAAQPTT
ncbi:ribosomal protein S7 domain-containing protein [Mycena crocata]|nr:ribosomal protein S7 domain-containing protein [Mycena crocata]